MHSWIKLLCTTMLDHSVDSTDTLSWAWETGYLVLSDFILHIHFFFGGGCSHEGLLVCSYMYNNRALIENATNWQTYKSRYIRTVRVCIYTGQPFFIWYVFICLHCILFVFKDDYFNETRLSEIKYFRFDKFVRSPALYFWWRFLCCCTNMSPFLYCCIISWSANWLSVEYHFVTLSENLLINYVYLHI